MEGLRLYDRENVGSFSKSIIMETAKRVVFIVFLIAVLGTIRALSYAQIVITEDEIPATPGTIFEYSVEAGKSIPVELGFVGGPQVWDFSQASTPDTADTVMERIVTLEDTPFAESFPEANLVLETGAVNIVGVDTASGFQFMSLDEGSLEFLGFGFQDDAGNPYVVNLETSLTTLPFPLEYNATWSDESQFSGTFRVPNPEGSPLPGEYVNVKVDLEYSREGQVDGWGTVVVPQGRHEALRIRRLETTFVNFSVFIAFFGYISVFDTTLSVTMYEWYTEDLGSILRITGRPDEEDLLFSAATSVRKLTWTNASGERPGDVNGDGAVDVQDIIATLNHILEIENLEGGAFERADCNGDGEIDLRDVWGIVSEILGLGGCGPGVNKPEVTPAAMEFIESLKPYFSAGDFTRLMDLVGEEMGVPNEYSLSQNYPNPFNATTDIRYQIPDVQPPVRIVLKIYNILGREVATLVDEVKNPGRYTVTWHGKDDQGSDVSSGVYFFRLTTEEFTAAKRMVLMK
jgi:hypothetical protein